MRCFNRISVVFACSLALAPASALAVDKSPSETSTFTFIFENDLFANTDQQYTSGLQLGWLSPDLKHYEEEHRLLPMVHAMPFINVPASQPASQHNAGFTLGQQTMSVLPSGAV